MAKTKVVHIISGLENGGAEGVLFRLIDSSLNHNDSIEHVVVSLSGSGVYGARLEKKGIKVICLSMAKSPASIYSFYVLMRILKREKPCVVQTWMYHADLIGGIAAKLVGIKEILWNIRHSDLNSKHSSKTTVALAKLSAVLSYFIPKRIITCAEKAKDVHVALGYKADKFVIINNGYDLSRFRKKLPSIRMLSSPVRIGTVARFNHQKGHDVLLRAVREVAEDNLIELVLVGNGMNMTNQPLVDLIPNSLLDQVELLGPVENIESVMHTLDIHVLPSIAGEGFPNVVAEAMACGVPCIVTDVGDSAFIVGQTGWVIQPNRPEQLVKALNDAINEIKFEPESWLARGALSASRIEDKFDIERMRLLYESQWLSN